MKTTKWKIDPAHSELGFKIKHLMIAHVNGTFRKFDVTVETNGDDFATAHILATVEVQSIDTNQAQRDNHLRTSDFFEAEKFPIAVFNSTKVERTGEDTYNVIGDLTLKGITKQVTLGVEYSGITKDPYGGAGRAGFSVTGKINRTEWGINFNSVLETGGVALGEEVKLFSEVQVVKQAVEVAVPA